MCWTACRFSLGPVLDGLQLSLADYICECVGCSKELIGSCGLKGQQAKY